MCVWYLIQSKGLGQSKAPSLLKGSPDHGCARGGWSRGQAEWIWKLDTTNLNADVHLVHSTVEQRQLGNQVHCLSMKRLQEQKGHTLITLQTHHDAALDLVLCPKVT